MKYFHCNIINSLDKNYNVNSIADNPLIVTSSIHLSNVKKKKGLITLHIQQVNSCSRIVWFKQLRQALIIRRCVCDQICNLEYEFK